MQKRIIEIALSVFMVACGEGKGVILADPPEGYPTLSRSYDVTMSLLENDCESMGITPIAASDVKASVIQNGTEITWTQITDAGKWVLKGSLCKIDESFELHLKGISRVREYSETEVCEAYVSIPTALEACSQLDQEACIARSSCVWESDQCSDQTSEESDDCGTEGFLVLKIDENQISGNAEISLRFNRDCAIENTCHFQLNWEATAAY